MTPQVSSRPSSVESEVFVSAVDALECGSLREDRITDIPTAQILRDLPADDPSRVQDPAFSPGRRAFATVVKFRIPVTIVIQFRSDKSPLLEKLLSFRKVLTKIPLIPDNSRPSFNYVPS
jgi:hypothetical protein